MGGGKGALFFNSMENLISEFIFFFCMHRQTRALHKHCGAVLQFILLNELFMVLFVRSCAMEKDKAETGEVLTTSGANLLTLFHCHASCFATTPVSYGLEPRVSGEPGAL